MTQSDAWPTRVAGLGNDDLVSAFDGLLEGEAMLVEMALIGHDPLTADLRSELPGFWPHERRLVQAGVPSAVLESVSYAYTFGAEFAQALLRDSGWGAFGHAFARPPLSTEQVLHPDKYLGDPPDLPQRVPLDVSRALPHHELIDENCIGELGVVTMLRQWGRGDEAWGVAAGWDGDRVQVFLREGDAALVWRLVWDTPDDAASFAQSVMQRWDEEPDFAVQRREHEIVVIRGVPRELQEDVFALAWRGRPRPVRRTGPLIDRRVLRRWRRKRRERSEAP